MVLIYTAGKWSTPSMIGEPPPPCAGFTLTKISHTSALLYGGYNPQSGTCIRDCYITQVTHDVIVSNVLQGMILVTVLSPALEEIGYKSV